MIFKQEMTHDFQVLADVLRPNYRGKPVAFTRFADGESAILECKAFRADRDDWEIPDGKHPIWRGLYRALRCNLPGWHVGITAWEHHASSHEFLLSRVRVPQEQITLAEVFIFGNYWRFCEVDLSHATVVGCRNADFRVPYAGMNPLWDGIDDLVDDLLDEAISPILVAAGPLAKLICH